MKIDRVMMEKLLDGALDRIVEYPYSDGDPIRGVLQGRNLGVPEFREGTDLGNFSWRMVGFPHCFSFSYRKWKTGSVRHTSVTFHDGGLEQVKVVDEVFSGLKLADGVFLHWDFLDSRVGGGSNPFPV